MLLSILAVAVYLGALAWFSTTTPHYSTGKAFYALGLLPCFGVLATAGAAPLMHHPWARAATWALVATWAAASFGAYFVVG